MVYPYKKGGGAEKVLAMLKGGHNICLGSLKDIESRGGGAQKVLSS